MDMLTILREAVEHHASDIHLAVGRAPLARIQGEIVQFEGPPLDAQGAKNMLYSLLSKDQVKAFEENMELDFCYSVPGLARFRINIFLQKDGIAAAIRVIKGVIPGPEEILLPREVIKLCELPRGLILVAGPTGSGKSTTLACMLNYINHHRRQHILTIEDPIEFVYDQGHCLVTQREVGRQTHSFANALRSAMRQDPDVILVGEMRDLETIALAMTAAETGHLVFATLHTIDAAQTVDRIVDVFPPYQQQQIRVQLAGSLKAVICQTLLPRKDGQGRVAAREVMIVTPAIGNLIREGRTHQIYNAIDTGASLGMIPMDRSLADLVRQGLVDMDEALAKAHDPDVVRQYSLPPGARVSAGPPETRRMTLPNR